MIDSWLVDFSQLLRPYTQHISIVIIATLLVIYGDVINKMIRKQLKGWPFLLRVFSFSWICAFGYGAFIVFMTPAFKTLLLNIPLKWYGLSVLAIFTLIGLLAERRNYI